MIGSTLSTLIAESHGTLFSNRFLSYVRDFLEAHEPSEAEDTQRILRGLRSLLPHAGEINRRKILPAEWGAMAMDPTDVTASLYWWSGNEVYETLGLLGQIDIVRTCGCSEKPAPGALAAQSFVRNYLERVASLKRAGLIPAVAGRARIFALELLLREESERWPCQNFPQKLPEPKLPYLIRGTRAHCLALQLNRGSEGFEVLVDEFDGIDAADFHYIHPNAFSWWPKQVPRLMESGQAIFWTLIVIHFIKLEGHRSTEAELRKYLAEWLDVLFCVVVPRTRATRTASPRTLQILERLEHFYAPQG